MSDSAGITVLRLRPSLDLTAIDELLRDLRKARNTAVVIEAAEVSRVSTIALQALLSAWITWRSDGHDFHIRRPHRSRAAARLPARLPRSPRTRRMSLTILTVDDSRTMRDMLRMALAEAGFRVVQAEDGLHGLDVLRQEAPQVVITDINMPRMDGFGFIEAVRQDQTYRAVPILVLTTESDDEKKARARRAGATGWIVKPFDPAKLIAAVRRVAA